MERIVIVVSSFLSSSGSREKYNLYPASELNERGYNVHLLTNSGLESSMNEDNKYESQLTRQNGTAIMVT